MRVDGVARKLMCDRHWAGPVNLWDGEPAERPGLPVGPPPLLRVTFPQSDRLLLVSVLPSEVTELRLSGTGGRPDTRLTVRRLLDSDHRYVLAVVDRAQFGEPKAFDAAGRRVYYHLPDR
jgi:hypothetical protein